MSDEQAVRDAIEQFRNAVENRDIAALGQAVLQDEDILFYGSQAGDRQKGWKAVKASFEEQFSEADRIRSEVLSSQVSVVGDLAWAAYDLRYQESGGPKAGSFESRWTAVLRRKPEGWKCVHMHHSRGR
jgi:ketosteroid isomerase-like protein